MEIAPTVVTVVAMMVGVSEPLTWPVDPPPLRDGVKLVEEPGVALAETFTCRVTVGALEPGATAFG